MSKEKEEKDKYNEFVVNHDMEKEKSRIMRRNTVERIKNILKMTRGAREGERERERDRERERKRERERDRESEREIREKNKTKGGARGRGVKLKSEERDK